ncbi:MAG: hypothetical protein HYX95_01505 [Chloroflexi bacterium]|nr:hypothetical protein [Chloroflexota bacterium]
MEGRKVVVESCIYVFYRTTPDYENDWIFRYEYQRTSAATKPHAHFHVNAVHVRYTDVDYRHLHFPTGRLSIEQVLAHIIMEHGVQAQADDARSLLAESHKGFVSRRTDLEGPAFP